jgi:putative DNA primase/helicase
MSNESLDMVLKYAMIGISVMPLHGIKEDGWCTCSKGRKCTSSGKHPMYSGWHSIATTDKATVIKWWTNHLYANIGIPTGEKSG